MASVFFLPGATLGLIAPSGPFARDRFEHGYQRLQRSYRIVFDDSVFARNGYLAGDDPSRCKQILSMLQNPEIDAIVGIRGGYGATRLLPRIPIDLIQDAGKPLVGFSDLTALHARWQQANVPSMHGKMVATLAEASEQSLQQWQQVAAGKSSTWHVKTLRAGSASGPACGGNLAVCAALLGTPYEPIVDGGTLFFEDVTEAPYRIDRMLTSLQQAGWFQRAAAVVFGEFVQCDPRADGIQVEQVLQGFAQTVDIPVASQAPFGHGPVNRPFWIGEHVEVQLSAADGDVVLGRSSVNM